MSDPDDLPPDLRTALLDLGRAAEALHDPWWIFGGAALALYGMEALHVPDVDVLCSPRDARRLIQALGGEVEPDPGEGLFRSRVFGHATPGRMRIEVMAEMDVRSGGDWTPVVFATRQAFDIPDAAGDPVRVFTPSPQEHICVSRQFGRPKDLQRAEALERLISRP